MTTIKIKADTNHFTIIDTSTNEQIGSITVQNKKSGYGTGYYANHRATKGDTGVDVVGAITTDGEIANRVVEMAAAKHPLVKSGIRQATDTAIIEALDVQLYRMSFNEPVRQMGRLDKAATAAKKNLTFTI